MNKKSWEKLVRRWEHTNVQSKLYAWTSNIINPESLEPTSRSFFYDILGVMTHIHSKTYGPDHILTALYYDLVKRLINPAAPPLPESLTQKMRSIKFLIGGTLIDHTWTDEKGTPLNLSRCKKVIEFLESRSFQEVLTELGSEIISKSR